MKCIKDIQGLAWSKYNDAELLFEDGRFDSAFYLAGYTMELLLKAVICKMIRIENFFDFDDTVKKLLSKEAYKPFKVHDFSQLVVLSGMYEDLNVSIQNVEFKEHWITVIKWSEDNRYRVGKSEDDVKKFLSSIKIISTWIEKRL